MGGIQVHVDISSVMDGLNKLQNDIPRRAMTATCADLSKRVPSTVARIAGQTYALPRTKLNPNTKAGAANGAVSVGASIGGMSWEYKGSRLPIGAARGFTMKPKTARKSAYVLTTQILRGKWSRFGHWNKPWSEGGRYGRKSPWMLLPGHSVPLMREGKSFHSGANGLSIPQMVLSKRHEAQLKQEIQQLAIERLRHNISRLIG